MLDVNDTVLYDSKVVIENLGSPERIEDKVLFRGMPAGLGTTEPRLVKGTFCCRVERYAAMLSLHRTTGSIAGVFARHVKCGHMNRCVFCSVTARCQTGSSRYHHCSGGRGLIICGALDHELVQLAYLNGLLEGSRYRSSGATLRPGRLPVDPP